MCPTKYTGNFGTPFIELGSVVPTLTSEVTVH